jgi:hypothetical protein
MSQNADSVLAEVREIQEALAYCLQGTTIIGCPSPGLMEDTLQRLERLAGAQIDRYGSGQ